MCSQTASYVSLLAAFILHCEDGEEVSEGSVAVSW